MIKIYKDWKFKEEYNALDIKNIKHCETIAKALLKWKEPEDKYLSDNKYLRAIRELGYNLESY